MKKKQFILGVCFILLASLTGCRDSSIDQGKEVVQQEEVVSKEEPLIIQHLKNMLKMRW